MRFISGQYAPYMTSSAMLGYVFDGDIDKARSGINGYIKKTRGKISELKIQKPHELTRSSIMPNHPVDETIHQLENRLFTIYHIFLAV